MAPFLAARPPAAGDSAETFLAGLARRAAEKPELPWLFFRREFDWRWRSHRQVADHLARAAAAIGERGLAAATGLPLVGAESLSLLLAALAAGADFHPLDEAPPALPFLLPADAKWPEVLPEGLDRPVFELPAAHGNIDRYPATPLPAAGAGALLTRGKRLTLADLEAEAASIAALLFADEKPGKKIVHAGARLRPETAIALLIAARREGVVLAFEPYPPATLESVLWCRPTHLLATAEEVAALAAAWTSKTGKRSRLERILVAGEADPAWSGTFGVPVRGL